MGRRVEGTLNITGKDKHYQLRYQYEGKPRKQVLRNEQGQYIYDKREAEKAAQKILEPLQLKDKELQAQILQCQVNNARSAVEEARKKDKSTLCTVKNGWDKFMECPDRPRCCLGYKPGDIPLDHTNAKNYYSYYKRFQEWCSIALKNKTALGDITPANAQSFIQFLTDTEKMTSGTVGKYITFFKNFYSVLIANEYVDCKNPFERIRKEVNSSVRRAPFTNAEVRKILETAEGEYKTLFQLSLFTGMRLGDCCLLTWDMIDQERNTINYIPHKTAHTRKDPSQAYISVDIPAVLQEAFAQMIPSHVPAHYVFPELARHYQANDEHINRQLNRIFEQCGIQHHRKNTGQGSGKRAVVEKSFHSCRHWYASFCAEQGIPPQTVQKNLGHSSSAMTNYYTHTTDAMRQQVREVMDKAKDILFATETAEPADWQLPCFETNEPESIQPELF